MPGMTGLELLSEIQVDVMPMIVFVTAFDTFAVEAFKVHAIDYLLKPVEVDRLSEAIARAVRQKRLISLSQEKQKLLDLASSLSGKSRSAIGELIHSSGGTVYSDRLAIKDGSTTTFVPVRDIDWIDAAGDYMCVHVSDETHIMRTTMRELESILNPAIFQRVHRSTIAHSGHNLKLGLHNAGWNRKERRSAQGRNRTTDTGIFNPLLYQLSYLGKSDVSSMGRPRIKPSRP